LGGGRSVRGERDKSLEHLKEHEVRSLHVRRSAAVHRSNVKLDEVSIRRSRRNSRVVHRDGKTRNKGRTRTHIECVGLKERVRRIREEEII